MLYIYMGLENPIFWYGGIKIQYFDMSQQICAGSVNLLP